MRYENLKDTVELIGIAAIIGSLVFVGFQMRQAQEIAQSELDVSLVTVGVETASLINSDSEIWVSGNADGDLSPNEAAVFFNLIAILDARWFVEYRHQVQLGRPDIAEVIRYDWSAFLHQNPGARKVLLSRLENLVRYRQMLNPQGDDFSFWTTMIQADLAKLDEISG